MQYVTILKLVPIGVGMLLLAAGTSGCAADTQDPCSDDDPECQADVDWTDEAVASAEQEWGWGRRGLGRRPDLWGRRFMGPMGNPWIIGRGGFRHRIPDRFTYGNLWGGNDWNNLGYWDGLGGIPVGNSFGRGAFLAGVGGGCGCDVGIIDTCDPCGGIDWWDSCNPCGGEAYLVNDGYRYGFNRETFEGYGFGGGAFQRYGAGGLDGYPGADWRW